MRAIVQTIIANRPAIYATPELADVNNNRGDRINKKIHQVLEEMLDANGVADAGAMVGGEIAKSKRAMRATPSPKKTPTKGKKRKAKDEDDEEVSGDEALKKSRNGV